MRRASPYLALVLLALLPSCDIRAADYAEGLAPPGVPASAFPAPSRPVARIVNDTWHDEQSRDKVGEAERVMNLLGVKPGLTVADIGAGSGYYTVRLAKRVGPEGHVYAEDVVPEYLERLAQRVRSEGLTGTVTLVRGDPHDPQLPAGSVDIALLVHMYHEVQQPYGLLWNLRPALRTGAQVAVVDARKQTEVKGGHAVPGLVGAGHIVGGAALVGEGVRGVVAVDLVLDAGAFQHLLEIVDRGRRAPIVLVREVPLERHPDLGRVESLGGMP